jgi:GT2 family glycosyltransferase
VTISAIMPTHVGGRLFRRSLGSIMDARPAAAEVIVVADGSAEAAHEAGALGVRVVLTPERRGPAYARNLGARAARGDILVFIDADVLVPPDFFSRVAALFQQGPDVAAIIGSYDDAPEALNFLSQYKNLLHHYVHQEARAEASTFWGACGAIRRAVFLRLGGFDERIPRPAMEDVELGHRLRQHGHRICLVPSLQVKHLKTWSAGSLLLTDVFARAVPWTELILRDRMLTNDLNLRMPYRISVGLSVVLVGSAIAGLMHPAWFGAAVAAGLALVGLNLPVYRFFRARRGLWFTIRAVGWHWFSYLYSGVGVGLGVLRYLTGHRIIQKQERPLTARSVDLGELDA